MDFSALEPQMGLLIRRLSGLPRNETWRNLESRFPAFKLPHRFESLEELIQFHDPNKTTPFWFLDEEWDRLDKLAKAAVTVKVEPLTPNKDGVDPVADDSGSTEGLTARRVAVTSTATSKMPDKYAGPVPGATSAKRARDTTDSASDVKDIRGSGNKNLSRPSLVVPTNKTVRCVHDERSSVC